MIQGIPKFIILGSTLTTWGSFRRNNYVLHSDYNVTFVPSPRNGVSSECG